MVRTPRAEPYDLRQIRKVGWCANSQMLNNFRPTGTKAKVLAPRTRSRDLKQAEIGAMCAAGLVVRTQIAPNRAETGGLTWWIAIFFAAS